MKRVISILLMIVVLLSCTNISCFASENDDNIISNISTENDFSDNRIIIVLDNKTSLLFNQYTPEDFSSISCKQIYNLSATTDARIQSTINNINRHITEGVELQEYEGVALNDYRTILCLELDTHSKENVINAINKIQTYEGVEYVCPDYVITAYSSSTADPLSMDYSVDNVDYLELISLYDAWEITGGSDSVRVGVMDSGIDAGHEDLCDNVNTADAADFTDGWVNEDSNGMDCEFHGTSVAGIIGAKANNGKGIAGVCNNVELISLRIIDWDGRSYSSNAILAFQYALENDIDIINLSAGWNPPNPDDDDPHYDAVMSTAITNFQKLVVCAAGNDGNDIDVTDIYPAVYHCPNVIVVGASTGTDQKWYEIGRDDNNNPKVYASNYGDQTVDLFAPGYRILSTFPDDICSDSDLHIGEIASSCVETGYHWDSGTSLATPFVTGVAALMLSVNPNLSATQLKDIIVRSVDVIPALEDYCISGGRLNAYKAVRTAEMYRWANNISYEELSQDDTLYTKAHGVWYDNCECSCRNDDLSCGDDYCEYSCDPCEGCHYYFTQLHDLYTLRTASLYTHSIECVNCNYQSTENHNWIRRGTGYLCTICGQSEAFIPSDVMSLPDPEIRIYLASLSDEDLDSFIASLPEEQLDRVTALLPPEHDDELLTE